MKNPRIAVLVPCIDKDGLTDYWLKIHRYLKRYANVEIINHKIPYSKNPFYFINLGLAARKYDLLHIQHVYVFYGSLFNKFNNVYAFLVYAAAKMFGGPKIITTIHDVIEPKNLNFLQRSYLNFMNFPMKLFSDKIIVHKNSARNQLIKQGFDANRIVKLPFGVDIYKRTLSPSEARKKYRLPEKKTMILFGWIRKDKQFDKAIDALTLLPDMQAVVTDEHRAHEEKYYNSFRKDIINKKLQNRVIFVKAIPSKEKYNWLCCGDVMVLPYSRITSSGNQSDAISVGMPIVTSKLPEFQEVEKEWSVLKTTDVNSKKEFAKSIQDVIKNKLKFKEKMREYIKKNNRDEVAKLTKSVYDSVLAEK